jgi:hypothetical protein
LGATGGSRQRENRQQQGAQLIQRGKVCARSVHRFSFTRFSGPSKNSAVWQMSGAKDSGGAARRQGYLQASTARGLAPDVVAQ